MKQQDSDPACHRKQGHDTQIISRKNDGDRDGNNHLGDRRQYRSR